LSAGVKKSAREMRALHEECQMDRGSMGVGFAAGATVFGAAGCAGGGFAASAAVFGAAGFGFASGGAADVGEGEGEEAEADEQCFHVWSDAGMSAVGKKTL
jgi:hypothetical protein